MNEKLSELKMLARTYTSGGTEINLSKEPQNIDTSSKHVDKKRISKREILKLAEKECRAEHCQAAFYKGYRACLESMEGK